MTTPASVADTQMPLDEGPQQPTPPNYDELKLEGEGIPEELRGKPVTEALAYANKLKEALKISEEARTTAQQQFQLAVRQSPQAAAPIAPPEPEPLTDEQLQELHSTDPIKAIEYLNQRAIKQAERNLESRLGPMLQGTATVSENNARQTYATEFQLFGDQIDKLVESIPGGKQALTNPAAWDDLVALVRGRKGNFEKFIQHQTAAEVTRQQAAAQQQQREVAGHVATSAVRGGIPTSAAQLDATQLEIADKLGLTPQEYVKWSVQ